MRNNSFFLLPFLCSILLSLRPLVVSHQCLGSQQSLLLHLKDSLHFDVDFSVKLVNWNQSSDCCSWEGVTCEEGFVTHLDLSFDRINGTLDDSSPLFNLQHLKSLNLSLNHFNSTIPSRIGNLTNLVHLDLSYATFRGQIPIGIFGLKSLVTLDLSVNDFNSTIPTRIGNLTKLVHLDLSDAGFWGPIPTGISRLKGLVTLHLSSYWQDRGSLEIPNLSMLVRNLSNLQELGLGGVNISAPGNGWCEALSSSLPNLQVLSLFDSHVPGPLDPSLVTLQHLSDLDLGGTNLSSQIPQSFAKFMNLTYLNLGDCMLHGIFPSEIFLVPTLRIIDISWNEFLEVTLPEFTINNSLETLYLSSTKFVWRLPESLASLRSLSTLSLFMCQANGILPSSMLNLPQVNYVDLSSNNFTGPLPPLNLSTKFTSIDLSNNSFSGKIPLSWFGHPSLEHIFLSSNQFSGPIPEFQTTSSSLLNIIDLSDNNLEGLIPTSIFKLRSLTSLDLSYNEFNGTRNLQTIQVYNNLSTLDLSHNNIKSFPDLKSLSGLRTLDLSSNQISEEIPKWIWEVGNGSLINLNLSYNYLVGMQEPFFFPESLYYLDLRFNLQLQGNIPVLPYNLQYADLSSNNFTSLPYDIFHNVTGLEFLSLSNNSLTGDISEHICSVRFLKALDLSHNNLSGKIPTCLIETNDKLEMLNLGNNIFKGPIPDVFPIYCGLESLDLNGNFIEGGIPKSLANCTDLELLDLGHNELIGEFPCFLKRISTLHVLVLRSNKLYGSVGCLNDNGNWSKLQIVDLAYNNFSGELPQRWLTKLEGMMENIDDTYSKVLGLRNEAASVYSRHARYYPNFRYTVTVTSKGHEMELLKILAIFTCIDLSRNNFHGPIPIELGQLQGLYILNLSYNAFIGQIPSSIGNLRNLESLDLSWNNLSGRIPEQLQSLTFLAYLNVSFNQLVGMIPTGNQFRTFSEDSYIGNKGLCGFPLTKNCSDKAAGTSSPNAGKGNRSNSSKKIDWNLLSAEIGLFTGFGIVVSPLVFSQRWRRWYYERVDDIIIEIFPLALSRKWFLWTST